MTYRTIGQKGLELIKEFEGLKLDAYKCPAGVWTIGYGHTTDVSPGQHINEAQAEALLIADLDDVAKGLSSELKDLSLSQNMYDACISLAFNIGLYNFNRSTLKRFLVRHDFKSAAGEFVRWNKARGADGQLHPVSGLTRRREAERKLFLS